MARTAADVLIDTLEDWGVEVIFGMPGDGINGIMEALRLRQDKVRFIQVRHEESASFMAVGYAKYTGRLGVCLATTGPGAIHLLNGLYDAKMDGQPVLAITGLPYHDLIATQTQQDVETDKLFMDVAAFSTRIMGPAHVENVASQACRIAMSYRQPAHIAFPLDIQYAELDAPRSKRNVPGHTSDELAESAHLPTESDLVAAAEIINQGSRVVILAGRGALNATDELEQVAEVVGGPIVKPLLGKAAVPDDSPYTTGGIGLLGTLPSQEAIEKCDTLLLVGTSFPYIEFYPKPGQAKVVQIELDPKNVGLRQPVDAALVGDSRRTLQALIPMLQRKADRSFLETAQKGMRAWRESLATQAAADGTPMKPQVVAAELSKLLDDDAIVSLDSGTITTWGARFLDARRGQKFSVSGTLASMACGLPYAIAAAIAYPERQSIALVGDGGLAMLMADFATCVKYHLPVKVVVIKNNALGMIKWEQMVFLGNPEYACDLQPIDFAAFARACGAEGYQIEDPKDCAAMLRAALAAPGPCIIEALVDPLEPPMPPKVTSDQMKKMAKAFMRGEPNRERIALTILSDKVRQLI